MPTTQFSRKLSHASARSSTLSSRSWMSIGLNTLSSRCPLAPAMPIADVVAHHVGAHHRQRLGLRRVHLARHDRAAGLVRGQRRARRARSAGRSRAGARRFRSSCTRSRARASRRSPRRSRSCPASAANLFGAVRNGSPVSSAILAATRGAHSGCEFSPVPTAVPPSARSRGRRAPRRASSRRTRAARPSRSSPGRA